MSGIWFNDYFSPQTDRAPPAGGAPPAGEASRSAGSRWRLAFVTAWIFTLALPGLLFILDAGGSPGSAAEISGNIAHGMRAAAAEPTRLEVYGTDRSAPMVLEQRPESATVATHGSSVEVISTAPPENQIPARAPVSGREALSPVGETGANATSPWVTSRPAAETSAEGEAPNRVPTGEATSEASRPEAEVPSAETNRDEKQEVIVTSAPPAWQQNAARAPAADGLAVVAVILDDLGLNRSGTRAAIELEAPLTLAFMSYADRLSPLLERARRRGHELMLHFPMEPVANDINPGPKALMVSHAPWEIRLFLEWGLARVPGIVGVNNHMGSRFTAEPEAMASVMDVLREKGLFYLDSRTTASDVGTASAAEAGVPFLARDVFLDHGEPDREAALEQLARLESIALSRGHAIGIGHPHDTTLSAIKAWRKGLAARGVILVPVTEILRRRLETGDARALAERR